MKKIIESFKEQVNFMMMFLWSIILIASYIVICKNLAPKLFNVEQADAYPLGLIIMVTTLFFGIQVYKRFKLLNTNTSQDKFHKLQQEYQNKVDELKKMQTENAALQGKNTDLANEIDTMKQNQYLTPAYKSTRQLQILTVSKSGNIVKEEDLYPLKNIDLFKNDFPNRKNLGLFDLSLKEKHGWKVFYSDNKVYRYGVGVKLEDIECAYDYSTEMLYFKNVKLSRLSRQGDNYNGYDPQKNVGNHVWILKKDSNHQYTIVNDPQHNSFKEHYRGYQQNIAGEIIQEEIDKLCFHYSEGLCKILMSRYGDRIRFVGENETIDGLQWMSLSEGMTKHKGVVSAFMHDLYIAFDTMELCADRNKVLDHALNAANYIPASSRAVCEPLQNSLEQLNNPL